MCVVVYVAGIAFHSVDGLPVIDGMHRSRYFHQQRHGIRDHSESESFPNFPSQQRPVPTPPLPAMSSLLSIFKLIDLRVTAASGRSGWHRLPGTRATLSNLDGFARASDRRPGYAHVLIIIMRNSGGKSRARCPVPNLKQTRVVTVRVAGGR